MNSVSLREPVIKSVSLCLVHVPDLVRYGSKPARDLSGNPELMARLIEHRRSYDEAVRYGPNQVFIGNALPESLWDDAQPWFDNLLMEADRFGRHGEIMPEGDFYCLMRACDDFDLFWLDSRFVENALPTFRNHPLVTQTDVLALGQGREAQEINKKLDQAAAIPIFHEDRVVGCLCHGHPEDASLAAGVLLENLVSKASAVLALRHALRGNETLASDIDYLIGCG